MSYQPQWDIDLALGEAYELQAAKTLGLASCKIEVKADCRYVETGNVFIEVAQLPRGAAQYKPRGIHVSEADYWAFTAGSAITMIPTQVIREVVAAQKNAPIDGGLLGDNPTKGYALSLRGLITKTAQYGLSS